MILFLQKLRKNKAHYLGIAAWCIYDWGASAFSTVILTFIFAPYFIKNVSTDPLRATAEWGRALAIAGVGIAIFSPILGAIADHEGRRKPWLVLFAVIAIISMSLLWFVKPDPIYISMALFFVVFSYMSLEIAGVFYNALLQDLVSEQHIGRISGLGWGLGYLGGLVSLMFAEFLFINAGEIRSCGPWVAIWYFLFAWPLLLWTPDRRPTGIGYKQAMIIGMRTLCRTLRQLPSHPSLFKFLIARMLYIDGLNTMFAFGGIYAVGTFHMSISDAAILGIAMTIAAGVGAIGGGFLDDIWGSKWTIVLALSVVIISGIGLLMVNQLFWFWVCGIILSFCVGPVQAASRSMMVRIVPKALVTEMFGLYAFSGKATAFMGPWLLSIFTLYFQSQRLGFSPIIIFLIVGLALLLAVS